MDVVEAAKVLVRFRHNNRTDWIPNRTFGLYSVLCDDRHKVLREFEAVAIAEKYLREAGEEV